VVTDTEATMTAAGQLFVSKSVDEGGTTKWIGCIDHLLQLVTRKAFSDLPMSEGALKECHNLVNYFNSSSQAMKKLLGKQVVGRAVKPVQDVTTRWWNMRVNIRYYLYWPLGCFALQQHQPPALGINFNDRFFLCTFTSSY
jgi:hypothetical protein